ncbi:hypothetical protein JTB14_016940 [Gonioctena quinquepunctata]|nr:hypothetical protein JTB14_016940 [Gonioctena quinquepunctata]
MDKRFSFGVRKCALTYAKPLVMCLVYQIRKKVDDFDYQGDDDFGSREGCFGYQGDGCFGYQEMDASAARRWILTTENNFVTGRDDTNKMDD